jgi:hypothetical protein
MQTGALFSSGGLWVSGGNTEVFVEFNVLHLVVADVAVRMSLMYCDKATSLRICSAVAPNHACRNLH